MQFIDAIKKMASLDSCLKNAKWWKSSQNRSSPDQNRFVSKYSWIEPTEPMDRGKYAYVGSWVTYASRLVSAFVKSHTGRKGSV